MPAGTVDLGNDVGPALVTTPELQSSSGHGHGWMALEKRALCPGPRAGAGDRRRSSGVLLRAWCPGSEGQRAAGASGKSLDDIESTRTAAGRTDRRPFPLALWGVTVPAPVSPPPPHALPTAVK